MSLTALQAAHPAFTEDVFAWLEPAAAAERRDSFGGTGWGEVEGQVRKLRGGG